MIRGKTKNDKKLTSGKIHYELIIIKTYIYIQNR